eukprot:scaffold226658_cov40-Prasinocladus_malaysianus.AAC.2
MAIYSSALSVSQSVTTACIRSCVMGHIVGVQKLQDDLEVVVMKLFEALLIMAVVCHLTRNNQGRPPYPGQLIYLLLCTETLKDMASSLSGRCTTEHQVSAESPRADAVKSLF